MPSSQFFIICAALFARGFAVLDSDDDTVFIQQRANVGIETDEHATWEAHSNLASEAISLRLSTRVQQCVSITTGSSSDDDGYLSLWVKVDGTYESIYMDTYFHHGVSVLDRCFDGEVDEVRVGNSRTNAWVGRFWYYYKIDGNTQGSHYMYCYICSRAGVANEITVDGNSDSGDMANTHCFDGEICYLSREITLSPTALPTPSPTPFPTRTPTTPYPTRTPTTPYPTSTEADSCASATDLATLTSPHSDSTANAANGLSTCGRGKERIFYYDLPAGRTIRIAQTSNSYDSKHETRWGGSCPGAHSVQCTDDPDTVRHSWTNDQNSTQRVFFIVDAYSATGTGTFTIDWEVVQQVPIAWYLGQQNATCHDVCSQFGSTCSEHGWPTNQFEFDEIVSQTNANCTSSTAGSASFNPSFHVDTGNCYWRNSNIDSINKCGRISSLYRRFCPCATAPPSSVPPTPTPTAEFQRISSGTCASFGMVDLTTATQCESAAQQLGLADTTAYTECNSSSTASSCTDRPTGCIYADNDWLQFNARATSIACGTLHRPYTYDCICKAPPPSVSPTPTPTAPPTPTALPAPVLPDAPHHALQLAENSLGVAGGIMRFDDIMEDGTQLVMENVTEYTPFKPNVTGLTAPNSSMAQISLGCGDKVEMVFSFLLASEPKEMDSFDFTVADLDKGAHERCAEMVEVVGYTNYSLYPSSSIQVEPGTPFLFIGTAGGSSADNPENIETMTDEQKSKAVSFVMEKRDAFTVLFSTTEPGVSSDDPDVVGYNGRRILFGFGTP